jgi:hypothetical protein
MDDKLSDKTLRELLFRKMGDSTVLNEDLAHCERLPVESPARCIAYLWRCTDRASKRQREKANVDAQERAMKGEIAAPKLGGVGLTEKQKAKEKEQKRAKEEQTKAMEALAAAPAPGPAPQKPGKAAGAGRGRDPIP